MNRRRRQIVARVLALTLIASPHAIAAPADAPAGHADAPAGQMTWALHFTLAPTLFEPAETPGLITPFPILYALHDALVKPMPGNPFTPSLAESWAVSKDGLTYDFFLRKGVRFHNGDPLSAEDVKFSFERYKGGGATTLKARVASVEVVDAHRVRFRLKQPWPDFMTFYATPATSAAWIVPKKYVERVGDDGFKKAPVGAGPYRFVSFTPGIELVVEAFDGYWRKPPAVKRLVFKSVPDDSTRLVMLKRGETDIAAGFRGPNAEEVKRTPGLTLRVTLPTVSQWVVFTEQWDPRSPWADRRVRLAANLAIDRKAFSDAEFLGHGRPASSIIPRDFDFYWTPPAYPYDPARAKQLLAEAGYPKGFDAGDFWCEPATSTVSEAAIGYLQAAGIRVRLRPLERAAFFKGYQEKKLKDIAYTITGAFGNAATRIETFVASGGTYVYGGYPDIDGLFREQAGELDRKRREAMLQRVQQLMHGKGIYAP